MTPYNSLDLADIASHTQKDPKGFDYLEAAYVIKILNQIFPLAWSFEVLSAPTFHTLVAGVNQRTGEAQITELAYTRVRLTIHTEGRSIIQEATGCQPFVGERQRETGIKGAESDGLKRCAKNLGYQFGLSLYLDDPLDEKIGKMRAHQETITPDDLAGVRSNAPLHMATKKTAPATPSTPSENVTCHYCDKIISDTKVIDWCKNKRVVNGNVDWACYDCQYAQRNAGLGVE